MIISTDIILITIKLNTLFSLIFNACRCCSIECSSFSSAIVDDRVLQGCTNYIHLKIVDELRVNVNVGGGPIFHI